MRVLVTGGTGKTGSAVARGLRANGVTPVIASRRPSGPEQVHFDWADPGTHDAALRDIDAAYLVAPALVRDPAPLMVPFVDRAITRGARRFVLLSSSAIDAGAPGIGAVHAALAARAPEWTVLRPSWFMQNFSDPQHALGRELRDEHTLASSTGDGRIGFIDAEDIAAVAVATLLAPANAALVLTGPEALSYADAAAILSRVLGETVVHRALTRAAWEAHVIATGMPAEYAALLGALEQAIAGGAEDRVTDEVLRRTGRAPRSFEAFARAAFAGAP
ncbi:NAD(P)H-binding protein [Nannocystis sp. SCPEA4]|uniref:NAD(P)H-binding protein n=1 Tax=Nannocystis sp. SCPEA4 TaxID=2996787 RepID=UPI00226EC8B2|nr:NAD(P)H-binding protein [Nannocystis sp. SCPEA4]MCY1054843.1 NAD(P)H-binding protein [Nannocystis sp. SCPEA4]